MLSNIDNTYDVIIVGGGVNGCGIARDLALRDVKCLLVEKNDFSAGTSGASSGMIHGGLRYLLSDVGVTRLSCLDSGIIQKIAPHLLFRIPFLLTVYDNKKHSGLKAKLYLEAVEAYLEAYDAFSHLKNAKKHTRLSPKEILGLEPGITADKLVGGVMFDEWGIDVPRLCVANAVDAKEHGVHVLNHTEVLKVIKEDNAVTGVQLKDLLTGETKNVSCRILVNATGPWTSDFAELFGADIKIRRTKGIHVTFDRKLCHMAIVSQAIDGRDIFLLPYENSTILGTTDDDFFGDLDNQRCTEDEIQYLLDSMESVFPALKKARKINTYSGVRPTLYERFCYEDDLSREHEVIDHAKREGIDGVVSLIGGKLASYRIMAKETSDMVVKKLGLSAESTTHDCFLPGGSDLPDVIPLAKDYHVEPYLVSRLIYRHGSRAIRILDAIKNNPELGVCVCSCEPVTKAEVDYVIENEMARTLSDVRRRTRFSMGPCQGTNCLIDVSSLLADIQDQTPEEHQKALSAFLKEWESNRVCVLEGEQRKQEELLKAVLFCNNSLDV